MLTGQHAHPDTASGRSNLPEPRRRLATLAAVALYAAVATVFLLDIRTPATSPTDATALDLRSQYWPMMRYGFGELRAGRLPLWNPHENCGGPLLMTPHVGFLYPLFLPFWFLPTARAIDVDVVVHLTVAAVGMFLLCRRFRFGFGAALIAGLAYAFHGSMMMKTYHPGFRVSAAWIPWIFLLVDAVLVAPSARAAALLAVAVGLSLLGGHGLQFAYFTALALVPLVAVRSALHVVRRDVATSARGLGLLAVAGALGLLLALVRVWPSAEFVGQSWRPPGGLPTAAATPGAMDPMTFVRNLVGPPAVAGVLKDTVRQSYCGLVPLVAALVGLIWGRPRSVCLATAAAGAGAAWYSFGPASPLFRATLHLPVGGWFRGPDRALIVFGFAVAFLAGAGLHELLGSSGDVGRTGTWSRALTAVVVTVLLALGGTVLAGGRDTTALVATAGLLIAIVAVEAARRGVPAMRAGAAAILAVVVAVELIGGQHLNGRLPSQDGDVPSRYEPFFRDIRARQELARTYIAAGADPSGPLYFFSDLAKAGTNHGLWLVTDYEPVATERLERVLGYPDDNPLAWAFGFVPITPARANLRLLALTGARFFLMPEAAEHRFVDASLDGVPPWRLLRREDGVALYELTAAVPRAFVAGRVEVVPQARALDRVAEAGGVDLAIVEEPIDVAPTDGSPVEATIVDYEPSRVRVDTAGTRAGLLVLTDQYYPGWRATVDGRAVPIHRADYLFRGVQVPAGRHRVEFSYRPLSFWGGAAGSLVGVLVLAGMLVRRPRVAGSRVDDG